jgi:hypothetical protein
MNPNNETSGVNTVLIVILLLIVVAGGVWYFTKDKTEDMDNQNDSLNIDLSLGEENGETLPQ